MTPGNLQGGFDWYVGFHDARIRQMNQAPLDLPPLEMPTRVLWGASDPVLKAEWSDRLHDYFRNAEVTIVPEAGHFVPYERPDYANAEILRFFRRVFAL
ncbi:MAG: alpha/beta hydrolase [Proteobacteria bacterium]|nr:alpha/beta hydrolase [Pseudomonadota bacterium]